MNDPHSWLIGTVALFALLGVTWLLSPTAKVFFLLLSGLNAVFFVLNVYQGRWWHAALSAAAGLAVVYTALNKKNRHFQ